MDKEAAAAEFSKRKNVRRPRPSTSSNNAISPRNTPEQLCHCRSAGRHFTTLNKPAIASIVALLAARTTKVNALQLVEWVIAELSQRSCRCDRSKRSRGEIVQLSGTG